MFHCLQEIALVVTIIIAFTTPRAKMDSAQRLITGELVLLCATAVNYLPPQLSTAPKVPPCVLQANICI